MFVCLQWLGRRTTSRNRSISCALAAGIGARHSLAVPDPVCVLLDGAVGGEEPHTSDRHQALLGPLLLVLVRLVHSVMAFQVGGEISGKEVAILAVLNGIQHRLEVNGVSELSGADHVAHVLEASVPACTLLHAAGSISDLRALEAEDEDVLLANVLLDLDVGTVVGADDDAAVHHELHVGRARRLSSRRGDVLRDVVGGDDDLGVSDLVVGDEDELEEVLGVRVVVDDTADRGGERDDALGHVVASSSLAADEAGLGNHVLALVRAHLLELRVAVDDLEHVEQLALVLVDTLHLDVEHRVAVHVDVERLLDVRSKALLVLELGIHQLVEHLLVIRELLQPVEERQIAHPAISAKGLGDQRVERGVALRKPAAAGHAVGDADELVGDALLGVVLDKHGEHVGLDDLSVDGSDTVDLERADDGKVGHADHLVIAVTLDDGKRAELVPVIAEHALGLVEPAPVDLKDDLGDAGEEGAHEGQGPLLESLGKHSVIGVCEHLAHDGPGKGPAEVILIHEEAHKLGDADGRMGVIELHRHLVWKLLPAASGLGSHERPDHVLDGGGHEEVLLLETKLLTSLVVVVGVENLGDLESALTGAKGSAIISLVELAEVDVLVGHGGPETERVGVERIISRDGHVVSGGHHPLGSVEGNRVADVETLDLPGVALGEPCVGKLNLVAILEALLEHTVLIADAVTPRGEVERRHRVKEASSQAAETSVSKRSVLLLFNKILELVADLLKRLLVGLGEVEVHECVQKGATHQELERQVINPLGVFLQIVGLGVAEGLNQIIPERQSNSLVRRLIIEVVPIGREGVLGMMNYRLLDGSLVRGFVGVGERPDLLLCGILATRTRSLHIRL
mmetsp:Transcript_36390/g.74689  ORF Transcript_36390/g.74689 Transcript_36390/m.74689 type:complete len:855 (+) Transcript_36390:63-2627(+)